MRKKIIFIDSLIMIIIVLLIILDYIFFIKIKIGNREYFAFWLDLGLILFYYSVIKSILGIILFIKNIIQKNILILSKKILFLFIPSLLLSIYICHFLFERLLLGFYIGIEMMIPSIIIIIGCITLLCYYILNKTLYIKMYNKIIFAIILPLSYFMGYFITWAVILA